MSDMALNLPWYSYLQMESLLVATDGHKDVKGDDQNTSKVWTPFYQLKISIHQCE